MDVANAPELLKVVESLKKIAVEAKLEEPLEISQPIEANPISLTPWIICLRSGASERAKKLVYSVFFKNNEYVSSRPTAIVDHCEAQVFAVLHE
jgi:hypothetical protein